MKKSIKTIGRLEEYIDRLNMSDDLPLHEDTPIKVYVRSEVLGFDLMKSEDGTIYIMVRDKL